MKHFKFLLINIVAFSALFFLISLLFPGQLVTSKTISVAVSKEKIAAKLNNTTDWKSWNGFADATAVTTHTTSNADSLVFSFENNSHHQLQSHYILYQEQANAVMLNWALIEKLPWYKPWKKFSAMVTSKEVAAVMDSSLNTFKIQIEAAK
jgi:hypothetical protein